MSRYFISIHFFFNILLFQDKWPWLSVLRLCLRMAETPSMCEGGEDNTQKYRELGRGGR